MGLLRFLLRPTLEQQQKLERESRSNENSSTALAIICLIGLVPLTSLALLGVVDLAVKGGFPQAGLAGCWGPIGAGVLLGFVVPVAVSNALAKLAYAPPREAVHLVGDSRRSLSASIRVLSRLVLMVLIGGGAIFLLNHLPKQ